MWSEMGNPDLPQRIRDRHPHGVDAVLELIGNSTVVGMPVTQLPSGVHLSFFGTFVFDAPAFPTAEIPMQTIVERVERGVYKAKPARVFRFEEIREAHRLMETGTANGKIVATPLEDAGF
ncbi:MAG TPA: zinc-binding dehydrogenase [Vicinamibacterales bacterium]|jgi:NADPH2:quinone reductase|nr:zinc-binding dehydrogenase [Vicinamibacterales bacterium]